MLILWLVGLLGSFLCSTFSLNNGLLLSTLAVVGGIAGYRLLGGPRAVFWRGQFGVLFCFASLRGSFIPPARNR